MSACPNCNKLILEVGVTYGINPNAICRCSNTNHPTTEDNEQSTCADCKVVQSKSLFHLRKDGRPYAYCRSCQLVRNRASYERTRDISLERQKSYRRTDNGRATQRKFIRKADLKDPIKNIARGKLRFAVKAGKIRKEDCRDCGDARVQAHHYNGYDGDNWSKVIWLCAFHHRKEHGFLTESYIKERESI